MSVHICSFSGALGDMPKRLRRDSEAVLAVLREHPRFSTFDVDKPLGITLDALSSQRRLKYDETEPYPWCRVEVLPPTVACPTCGARGVLATGLRGKWKYRSCGQCGGSGYVEMSAPAPAPSEEPRP